MANRSYLYSLSNRPCSYADRPERIHGLSEWPHDVPFMYRLLMSGDPRLCASLISDGLDEDEPGQPTQLHAISSPFQPGLERVKRFVEIAKALIAQDASMAHAAATATTTADRSSFGQRIARLFRVTASPPPEASAEVPTEVAGHEHIVGWLDETVAFLEAHQDEFLLLETVELDLMSESEEQALRDCVEQELARCRDAGAAVDALPSELAAAVRGLRELIKTKGPHPWEALHGLRLDDDCDNTRGGTTQRPLGLQWFETLYFDLLNREQFEAHQRERG